MGCTECESATKCTACDPDKSIRDDLCKCEIGKYIDDNDVCQECSSAINYCVECDTSSDCLKCQNGTDREPKNGQCPCK